MKIITFLKTELFSPETNAVTRFVSYETATTIFSVDLVTKNLELEKMGSILIFGSHKYTGATDYRWYDDNKIHSNLSHNLNIAFQ